MSIEVKQTYFKSSNGINDIRTRIWEDKDVEKIGIFQIAHGVSEHIERYDDFARFIASKGYVVVGNDHLGHGLSAKKEDLGFFADEDGDVRLIDDMHILHNIMVKRYPNLPYILFGHSLGSFCARVYARDFGNELSALILCGTGDVPMITAAFQKPLKLAAKLINKNVKVNATAAFGLLSKFSKGEKKKYPDLDWLSFNMDNIEKYANDELCGIPLTMAGNRDGLALINKACSKKFYKNVPAELPIMLISGEKDPVGMNGKGVLAVNKKLEKSGHNTKCILYPNMKHEILNEVDHLKVYEDIHDFLVNM